MPGEDHVYTGVMMCGRRQGFRNFVMPWRRFVYHLREQAVLLLRQEILVMHWQRFVRDYLRLQRSAHQATPRADPYNSKKGRMDTKQDSKLIKDTRRKMCSCACQARAEDAEGQCGLPCSGVSHPEYEDHLCDFHCVLINVSHLATK